VTALFLDIPLIPEPALEGIDVPAMHLAAVLPLVRETLGFAVMFAYAFIPVLLVRC